jgi:hypothetical protein
MMTQFGQRRILNIEVVAHPLRLAMTDEDEFHAIGLYGSTAAHAGFVGIACAG